MLLVACQPPREQLPRNTVAKPTIVRAPHVCESLAPRGKTVLVGRVTDENGDPVGGVAFIVSAAGVQIYEAEYSDKNGCFVVPRERADTLTLYYAEVTEVYPLAPPDERITVKDLVLPR